MTVGAVLMIGPACIGFAGSPQLAIALFCIGGFAHQMLNGALLTLCTDVFDTRTVGTASGMAGTIAGTGGMLFTFVIGKSADSFGYDPLFVALAALISSVRWCCGCCSRLGRSVARRNSAAAHHAPPREPVAGERCLRHRGAPQPGGEVARIEGIAGAARVHRVEHRGRRDHRTVGRWQPPAPSFTTVSRQPSADQ